MRTLTFAFAAASSLLLLAGCSTTVTFTSDIEGATVTTKEGRVYGITPVSIQFSNTALDDSRDLQGCARIMGVTYKWPSGATVSSPDPILLCGGSSSYVVQYDRPSDAPDIEKDLQNALTRAKIREEQLRTELELERMDHDMFWMMHPGFYYGPMLMVPPPRPMPPRPPVHRPPMPPRR